MTGGQDELITSVQAIHRFNLCKYSKAMTAALSIAVSFPAPPVPPECCRLSSCVPRPRPDRFPVRRRAYLPPESGESPCPAPSEAVRRNPIGALRIPVRRDRWSFARSCPSPAPELREGRPPGALRLPRGGEPQSPAGPPGCAAFPTPSPARPRVRRPVRYGPPPRPLAGLPRRPAGLRPRCPRPAPKRCRAYRASRSLSRARS